jgi:transcriptional regulator with XRE-family HTH domain
MIEKDLRIALGDNLRMYRKRRGYMQEELAKEIGISVPFLSDIENGKKWVSPATLAKIAEVIKIDAYMLLMTENSLTNNVKSPIG